MNIKSMNVQTLKQKLDQNERLILVDCREQGEWNEGHIPQAVFIPLSQIEEKYAQVLKNKNDRIVLQCRSGKRSMAAAGFLKEHGYTDLTNLEGGIMDWVSAGLPTTRD